MKEIAKRIWNEPAVAIGLLLSLAMLGVTFINGDDWDWDTIVLILGPLLTGLGTRSFVTPTSKVKQTPPVVVQTPPATDAERSQGF